MIIQPSDHGKHVARFTYAKTEDIRAAIDAVMASREQWEAKSLKLVP